MNGEWRVTGGEMYDAAPNTISCWRVYELDRTGMEVRTVAVFFVSADAWAVVSSHNAALRDEVGEPSVYTP